MSDSYLDPIINRHRPTRFKDVVGNVETVKALERRVTEPGAPHAYLFIGPSGLGKTTLARIVASTLGADVEEHDAGMFNGVDAMRELMVLARHMSMVGSGRRMVILNEVQALTRNAWNSLLTILEEPPPHLYFALTTTEPARIPEAVQGRCHPVQLDSVKSSLIHELLEDIANKEGWETGQDIIRMVLSNCEGSPRHAIKMLATVYDYDDVIEAERAIQLYQPTEAMINLLAYLLRTSEPQWMEVRKFLDNMEDADFVNAPIRCGRYLIKVMSNTKYEHSAHRAWQIMDALYLPQSTFDPRAAFFNAIGRLVVWSTRR